MNIYHALGVVFTFEFWINALSLQMITMIEATITLSMYQSITQEAADVRKEFMGICISDLVHGLLALLPVTLPMGRNMVGFQSGANHKVFNLLNFLILAVFFFCLLGFFGYVPTFVLKAMNMSSAYLLWDIDRILSYWRVNKFYQILVIMVPVGMMLNDASVMIVCTLAASWIYYIFRIKNKPEKSIKIYRT